MKNATRTCSVGHDFIPTRAIADTKTGNLTLAFSDDAVRFEAALPDDVDLCLAGSGTPCLQIRGGQFRGVSPGFQVYGQGRGAAHSRAGQSR